MTDIRIILTVRCGPHQSELPNGQDIPSLTLRYVDSSSFLYTKYPLFLSLPFTATDKLYKSFKQTLINDNLKEATEPSFRYLRHIHHVLFSFMP